MLKEDMWQVFDYSVPTSFWLILHKNHVLGEVTNCLMLSLFCPPLSLLFPTRPCFLLVLWLCQLFHSLSLSLCFTISHTLFLSNLCLLCLCSLFAPTTAWTSPPLAPFLCSSSWRLQLCSSLFLAFLVRYRYNFSTLFVSRLQYVHISRFPTTNSRFSCLC